MVCYHVVWRGEFFLEYELDLYSIYDRLNWVLIVYRFYMLLIKYVRRRACQMVEAWQAGC
jgi:hypothetical protein